MGRHVFCCVSSPCCSNCALNKTADDNKVKCGPEAVDAFKINFYVDDMLKSVASVSDAITLVKIIIGMCRAIRFRLNKFISNSNKLLMSTLQTDR